MNRRQVFPLLLLLLSVAVCLAGCSSDVFPMRLRGGRVYKEIVHRENLHMARRKAGHQRNKTANWFDQLIDHANPAKGTFKQRYFLDHTTYNESSNIALIYISGEAPLVGSPNGYVYDVAADNGAMMFSLEHRFYGESLPYPITDKANLMKYLTIESALADLAHFLDFADTHLMHKQMKWLCVGGSYAGALSAWLKEKYPHRLAASWSSSGVVEPRYDFFDFDHHVKTVISDDCAKALRSIFVSIRDVYQQGTPADWAALLNKFQTPSYFSFEDFAWMLADGGAMSVQYGQKSQLCNSILPVPADPIGNYAAFLAEMWGAGFTSSCYYSTACLSNASMSAQWAPSDYQWVYQCCSQVGWWQVGFPSSLRLEEITTSYYIAQCRKAFSPTIWPDVYAFNAKFGGNQPQASNVFATQGSDDPWSTVGVRKSLSATYVEQLAQCDGCGHCGDLFAPDPQDAPSLVAQRTALSDHIAEWLR